MIGHTRHTTKGNEKRNENNHPFAGTAGQEKFALVHNGILANDRSIRSQLCLPKTKIETDSYIALQLLEHQKKLDFGSIKHMAEAVI